MTAPVKQASCPEGMVYIQGGTLNIRAEDLGEEERPLHVEVPSFCVDKYEFTNEDFTRFFHKKPPSPKGFDAPRQPLVTVDFNEADSFCKARLKRLPAEFEWEYMARGKSHTDQYATSDGQLEKNGKKQANDDSPKTKPVGSYEPNSFGIYDLTGNAWEWVTDPMGSVDSDLKVFRGNPWHGSYLRDMKISNRVISRTSFRRPSLGFRCVAGPRDPKKQI